MNAYRKSCNKPARAPSKWWLAALLLGCLPASLNAEGQSPLKARLMEEAPKAWEGYRGYFMNSVKGSSVAVSKELLGSEPPETIQWEWKNCDACSLSRFKSRKGTKYEGMVMAENSVYSFTLRRNRDGQPWVLANVTHKKPGARFPEGGPAIGLYPGNPVQPFPVLVKSPGFRWVNVVPVQESAVGLVHANFEYDGVDPPSALRKGWVIFDPAHDWVMRSGELNLVFGPGSNGTQVFEFDYRTGSSNHPIPTHHRMIATVIEGNRVTHRKEHSVKFDLSERRHAPESEFTLSAFGIPEPYELQPKSTRWYLWFAVAGIVCLMGAGAFRYLRQRATAVLHAP